MISFDFPSEAGRPNPLNGEAEKGRPSRMHENSSVNEL